MHRMLIALGVLTVTAWSAATAQAQATQLAPVLIAPRWETTAPMFEAVTRMQNFEVARRMARHSPSEHQRAQRRAAGILTATSTPCDVVNAAELGRTERHREVFEVACSSGYGYILVGSSPPAAYDCWQLSQAAQVVRASNPRADVGSQCGLRENGG